MATGVEELLDLLYDMLEDAKPVPFAGDKCMVERDKALDYLDDVRTQFPVEFAEARKLLATRNDYLSAARRDAELIRKQAEEQAKQMVGENELMTQARQKRDALLRQAEEQARELRQTTYRYCEDLLSRTEEVVAEATRSLGEAGKEIAQVRSDFRTAAAKLSGVRASFDVALDGEDD